MLQLIEKESLLEIQLTGLDMILACKSKISVPYSQINNVTAKPEESKCWFPNGVRFGTHIPGFIKKGSWYSMDGSSTFFFVSRHESTVGIEITPNQDISYRKLIIEVPRGRV